jgi:hypothetical protein
MGRLRYERVAGISLTFDYHGNKTRSKSLANRRRGQM